MLSQLDNIIFPDRCDVLEIDSQRYVYPIFKNGSSALKSVQHRVLGNDEIKQINTVDVFVRDPYERFLSGVQTYLRYNPHLHRETALHFISEYLFLNRHFCPQFHWLVNLQRHARVNMRLLPIAQISEITGSIENHYIPDLEIRRFFSKNPKVHFYLQLDKVLTENLLDQTVSMDDILNMMELHYLQVYTEVVTRSKNLCTVLD